MKRLFTVVIGVGLVVSMVGCGQPENGEAKTPMEETVESPNLFTDCETLEEAQELAGVSLTLPESLTGYPEKSFRAIDKRMLEVIYWEGETEKARVRKRG